MLIEYEPAKGLLILTIPEQENRQVSFKETDWFLCFQTIKEHGLRPKRRLHRRRAIKSLGETDRKMIEDFLLTKKTRELDKVYSDAIEVELEDL